MILRHADDVCLGLVQRLLGQNPELPQAPEQLEPLTIKLGTKTLEEMEVGGPRIMPTSHLPAPLCVV